MSGELIWYLNGRFVPPAEAQIPVTDLGLLRGYAIFESLRTYRRKPFQLDAHLDRLWGSADTLEMNLPWNKQELRRIIHESLEHNPDLPDALLRIIITGGQSEDGLLLSSDPTLAVLVTPLHSFGSAHATGITLATVKYERAEPTAKTTNYARALVALRDAKARGADDALYANAEGHVLECTNSNFFLFKGDTLVTAREGVLYGITRGVTLDLARSLFPIEERAISRDELAQAGEAFITSTSRAILPVVRIDTIEYGDGKPGPRTRRLMQAWEEMVSRL